MSLTFRVVGDPGKQFTRKLAGIADRVKDALLSSANILASMIEERARKDIAQSGNFGSRWTDGLHVGVDADTSANIRLSMYHDIPFADIFETGGQIQGHPFMWIPISGTDAEGVRASEYGGGLASSNYNRVSGPPLLFSIQDGGPRYFGVTSVHISKKWHLEQDARTAAADFPNIFQREFRNNG